MVVKRPIREIKQRAKAEGIGITEEQIDKTLEFYEDYLFNKLISGEEIKIRDVGKIKPIVTSGYTMLTGKKEAYETVKFKFTPFSMVKTKSKEALVQVQKKHL